MNVLKLEPRIEAKMPDAPTRGRLLSAQQIVPMLDPDGSLKLSPRWVKNHVRPRVELSARRFAWYERDVETWIAGRRKDVA